MARWEPGTPERLQQAALELFASQGYEQTTAADIAGSAGVTERTFFRHFADKREVLFHGQEAFADAFVSAVRDAPAGAAPFELVDAALRSGSAFFTEERRAQARMRHALIDGNPPLQERERHKMSALAATLATALRERGVAEPAATLAAESCTTVFGIAFVQWIRPGERRSLADLAARVLADLRSLATVT